MKHKYLDRYEIFWLDFFLKSWIKVCYSLNLKLESEINHFQKHYFISKYLASCAFGIDKFKSMNEHPKR